MLLLYLQQIQQIDTGVVVAPPVIPAGGGIPKIFLLDSEPAAQNKPQVKNRRKTGERAEIATPPAGAVGLPAAKPIPSLTQALVARYINQQTRLAQAQPTAQPGAQPLAATLDLTLLAVIPAQTVALATRRRGDDDALRLLLLLS